jgi:hypothetical protein
LGNNEYPNLIKDCSDAKEDAINSRKGTKQAKDRTIMMIFTEI